MSVVRKIHIRIFRTSDAERLGISRNVIAPNAEDRSRQSYAFYCRPKVGDKDNNRTFTTTGSTQAETR